MGCNFHSGQKVVCVNSEDAGALAFQTILIKGNIYTVYDVYEYDNNIYVRLEETGTKRGNGWFHWRFRPLIEKKTDISVFKKLENPTGKPAKVKELEKPKVVEKV